MNLIFNSLLLAVVACFPQASQTTPASQDDSTQEQTDSTVQQQDQQPTALDDYKQLKRRYKEIDNEINDIFSNLAVGIRAKQEKQMQQITALKKEREDLVLTTFNAAVEAFRTTDEPDRQLTRDLITYANACLGGNRYRFPVEANKTLGLCELIISKGGGVPAIHALASQAAYASHDFEKAIEHLATVSQSAEAAGKTEFGQRVSETASAWEAEASLIATQKNLPRARIVTSAGEITIELFEDSAPNSVANFVSLMKRDFYDGQSFFEVRRGEFCRAGCPKNNGTDGPGYQVATEAKLETARKHFSGYVSMVPFGDELHCGSQFIITQKPIFNFNESFTVVGRVIEGMEIVFEMQSPRRSNDGKLIEPVRIISTEVDYVRPGSTYVPNKVVVAEDTETDG